MDHYNQDDLEGDENDNEEEQTDAQYQQLPRYKKHRARIMKDMKGAIYAHTVKELSGLTSKLLTVEICRRIALTLESNGYEGFELAIRPRANYLFTQAYRDKHPKSSDVELMRSVSKIIRDAMWPKHVDPSSVSLGERLSKIDPQQMQRYRQINYKNTIFTREQMRVLNARN